MHTAKREMFTFRPDGITSEASSLGLGVGEWPQFIAITDEEGKGFLVALVRFEKSQDGEIRWAVYQDRAGALPIVTVFND